MSSRCSGCGRFYVGNLFDNCHGSHEGEACRCGFVGECCASARDIAGGTA